MGQVPATQSRTLKRYQLTPEQARDIYRAPLTCDFEHSTIVTLKPTPFFGAVRISDSPAIFLEQCDVTLDWVISRRLGTEKMIPQQDITKLIESCIYGLAYFQKKGLTALYDMHPSNVFFYREKRTWKIANPQLITPGYLQITNRFAPLPPEHIYTLRLGQTPVHSYKSDMFSLGIVLLEATSLQPMSDFYHPENYSIMELKIEAALKEIEKYYSELTVKAISLMLIYDPESRMDPIELSLFFHNELNIKPLIQSSAFTPKSDHPPFTSQIVYNQRPREPVSPPPQNYMQAPCSLPTGNLLTNPVFNPAPVVSYKTAPMGRSGMNPFAMLKTDDQPQEQFRMKNDVKHQQVSSIVYGRVGEQERSHETWEATVERLRLDIERSRAQLSTSHH